MLQHKFNVNCRQLYHSVSINMLQHNACRHSTETAICAVQITCGAAVHAISSKNAHYQQFYNTGSSTTRSMHKLLRMVGATHHLHHSSSKTITQWRHHGVLQRSAALLDVMSENY